MRVSTLPVLTVRRSKVAATATWFFLLAATLISSALGTNHGVSNPRVASTVIILLAFVKARLIGMHFMELNNAPLALRLAFEGYCVSVFVGVIGLYLAA